MKYFVLVLTLLVALLAPAQSAKVAVLSDQDAAEALRIHKAAEKAQADEQAFYKHIQSKYLAVPTDDKDAGNYCSAPSPNGEEEYPGFSTGIGSTWVTAGTYLSVGSDGCATYTAEDKKKAEEQKAAEKKAQAEYKEWRKKHPLYSYRRGWACGSFTFSEDFKYIVPVPEPKVSSPFDRIIATPLSFGGSSETTDVGPATGRR